jgi:hypothetical protein
MLPKFSIWPPETPATGPPPAAGALPPPPPLQPAAISIPLSAATDNTLTMILFVFMTQIPLPGLLKPAATA